MNSGRCLWLAVLVLFFPAGLRAEEPLQPAEFHNASTISDDKSAKEHSALGIGYYSDGLNDKALRELRTAIQLDPKDTESLLWLGYVYEDQKNYSAAIKAYQQIVELDPENINDLNTLDAYLSLAKVYVRLKLPQMASDYYLKALALAPDDQKLLYMVAEFYYEQKEYSRAIAYIKMNLGYSYSSKNYMLLEDCYLAQGKYMEAVSALFKAEPKLPWELLGLALFIFLPAVIVNALGRRMLKNLPSDEGEERIRHYHRFRHWSGRILGFGCISIGLAAGVLELEQVARFIMLPPAVLIFILIIITYTLTTVVSFRFDREVRRTQATVKDLLMLRSAGLLPFVLGSSLFYLLYQERTALLESPAGLVLYLGLLIALVYGLSALSPSVIRLFRKTIPVPEELQLRLEALCQKVGVKCRIFILDMTSWKVSNLWAAGLWSGNSRIYISSYALEVLSPPELDNVFLHELAHLKRGHPRTLVHLLFLLTLYWSLSDKVFSPENMEVPYYVFDLAALILYLFISRWVARRLEREADEFAVRHSDVPQAMIRALEKAYVDNYVPRNYKAPYHPRLEERIKYIQKKIETLKAGAG